VDQRTHEAVEATRDMVLTYQGVPILAAFSSTAAGPTEDAINVWSKDLPYLKGVECPFDRNSPHFEWQASFTLENLEAALQAQGLPVGTIASLTPYAYSRAGRVTKIRVLHSLGELILRGEELRRAVGYQVIRSTQFEIDSVGREVLLSGRGAGHAVGLCQWGTKELAELGYPFHAILYYYFPGTTLQPLYRTRLVFSAAR
jgi:stage II sporulation protein D